MNMQAMAGKIVSSQKAYHKTEQPSTSLENAEAQAGTRSLSRDPVAAQLSGAAKDSVEPLSPE